MSDQQTLNEQVVGDGLPMFPPHLCCCGTSAIGRASHNEAAMQPDEAFELIGCRDAMRLVSTGRPDDSSRGITTRELFESLTRRQQLLLLEAIGTVPRWVAGGNAIQRTAAAPVVFVRAYRSHRRGGMPVGRAAYWAWRWAQAFCF